MTIRKLLLTLSIVLSCGLIVGGIVSAQEAPKAPEAPKSPKAEVAQWDLKISKISTSTSIST